MVYVDYEEYRNKYLAIQQQFNLVLSKKEAIFTKTLPSGIRYDKEHVQSSPSSCPLEDYVISLEEQKIDEDLKHLRQLMEDREKLLDSKEKELRKSPDKYDTIYRLKYLDGYGVNKISSMLNYSKSQVYRMLCQIQKRCDKMRQNMC